mmetsp:Transcript_56940/g.144436  ORF Transcript_56940/g.144436 Transcript_56940/m.144436 type:complete len:121 (+) Transcript_56940:421-783(+)
MCGCACRQCAVHSTTEVKTSEASVRDKPRYNERKQLFEDQHLSACWVLPCRRPKIAPAGFAHLFLIEACKEASSSVSSICLRRGTLRRVDKFVEQQLRRSTSNFARHCVVCVGTLSCGHI